MQPALSQFGACICCRGVTAVCHPIARHHRPHCHPDERGRAGRQGWRGWRRPHECIEVGAVVEYEGAVRILPFPAAGHPPRFRVLSRPHAARCGQQVRLSSRSGGRGGAPGVSTCTSSHVLTCYPCTSATASLSLPADTRARRWRRYTHSTTGIHNTQLVAGASLQVLPALRGRTAPRVSERRPLSSTFYLVAPPRMTAQLAPQGAAATAAVRGRAAGLPGIGLAPCLWRGGEGVEAPSR